MASAVDVVQFFVLFAARSSTMPICGSSVDRTATCRPQVSNPRRLCVFNSLHMLLSIVFRLPSAKRNFDSRELKLWLLSSSSEVMKIMNATVVGESARLSLK